MARRGLWHAVLVLLVLRNAILASAGVFSGNDILALMAVGFVMPVRLPVWRWALGYYFGLADGGLWNAYSFWQAVGFGMQFGCGWRWLGHAILIANGLWTAILAFSGGGLLWHAILALSGALGCYFGMQLWL